MAWLDVDDARQVLSSSGIAVDDHYLTCRIVALDESADLASRVASIVRLHRVVRGPERLLDVVDVHDDHAAPEL